MQTQALTPVWRLYYRIPWAAAMWLQALTGAWGLITAAGFLQPAVLMPSNQITLGAGHQL